MSFETLTDSGSMRSGRLCEHPTLALRTDVSDSGSWPTATASDANSSGVAAYSDRPGRQVGTTLTDRAVRLWPTPKASQGGPEQAKASSETSTGLNLPTVVSNWPTPSARDEKGRGYEDGLPNVALSGHHDRTTTKPGQPQMVLNPLFVEWLMGWPLGWTDCERSAMESYLLWRQQHLSLLRSVLMPAVETGSYAAWVTEWAGLNK